MEIRRVPPNWQHPRYTEDNERPFSRNRVDGQFHPLHDMEFDEAASKWLTDCILWSKGEHPDQQTGKRDEFKFYWQWVGEPPDAEDYRPKFGEGEATWFQVYETESAGTPVTPPFATKEELVEYLATKGDLLSRKRGEGAWARHSAEKFVEWGWAPGLVGSAAKGFKSVNKTGFYP